MFRQNSYKNNSQTERKEKPQVTAVSQFSGARCIYHRVPCFHQSFSESSQRQRRSLNGGISTIYMYDTLFPHGKQVGSRQDPSLGSPHGRRVEQHARASRRPREREPAVTTPAVLQLFPHRSLWYSTLLRKTRSGNPGRCSRLKYPVNGRALILLSLLQLSSCSV